MTSPPSLALTEPSAGHSRDRVTDLSTKEGRKRFLMVELGVTGPQAKALIVAYQRDVADQERIGNETSRPDASFIDWLMRQAPSPRKPTIRRWQIGESAWRTR